MRLKIILALSLLLCGGHAFGQASPFSNSVFPAQTFTATGQTGNVIQMNGLVVSSTVGSSFTLGTITLTGTSLTTVTFSVMGSADNGATYYQLPISTVASPGATPTTTVTATANGLYQVSIAGITHIKLVTSGTFTATSVNLVFTATPNAGISRLGTSSGGGGVLPGTQYKLPNYNSGGSSVTPNNMTTDSTGNNLNIPGVTTTPNLNNEYYVTPSTNLQAVLTNAGNNVHIILPTGLYTISTTLQIFNNNVDFDCRGAVLLIDTASTDGVQIGDPTKNFYQTATYVKFRNCQFEPGVQQVAGAMIHDNGYGTTIDDVSVAANGSNYFHNIIQVDQDESLGIRNFQGNAMVIECDSGYCGNYLYNPPGTLNAAVAWISNSLFDPECSGNGIDWQGGNDFHSSGLIIQAYNQYAIRLNAAAAGNDNRALLDKTHIESGNCTNPWYINPNTSTAYSAEAGIIANHVSVVNHMGHDSISPVQFPVTGAAGSEVYYYYVVIHSSSSTTTAPMAVGEVVNGNPAISGSNYVNVTFPSVATATSCDLLRYDATANTEQGPYGTGNWAVATALTCNTGNVTNFTDNVTTPASYTINATSVQLWSFTPYLNYWPGFITLANYQYNTYQGEDLSFVPYAAEYPRGEVFQLEPGALIDNTSTKIPPPFLNTMGVIAGYSQKTTDGVGGYLWPASNPNTSETGQGLKGVINFGTPYASNGFDVLTIFDSNYMKTITNRQHLPSWDVGDSAFGIDTGNGEQFYMRAGQNLRAYIATLPDGTSWLWDLSASRQAFQIPQYHYNQTDIWYSDAGTTPTIHINGGTGQGLFNGGVGACNTGASHCATLTYNPNASASVNMQSPTVNGVLAVSIYNPTGTPTFPLGTGVTSVACATFYTCTNQRGELTVVGGTFTTGTIFTLTFSAALSAAPGLCMVSQVGGATNYGIGHGTPISTGVTVSSAVSVASATITLDYYCFP